MKRAKVIIDENSEGVEIFDQQELDQVLDQAHFDALNTIPIIVSIEMHSALVYIGLGLEDSFIHLMSSNNEPPYFATVGEDGLGGAIDFYLHGSHHTEILRRNLIPLDKARLIVKTFFDTGKRSDGVVWEEV